MDNPTKTETKPTSDSGLINQIRDWIKSRTAHGCECQSCKDGREFLEKIEQQTNNMKNKTLNEIAAIVHTNATEKGFHNLDEPIREFMANQCNNLHGEVSELWDAWRAGNEYADCDKAAKMRELGIYPLSTTEEEIADIVIRALDMSQRLGIDIARAVEVKHLYNKTRPHKHGKLN